MLLLFFFFLLGCFVVVVFASPDRINSSMIICLFWKKQIEKTMIILFLEGMLYCLSGVYWLYITEAYLVAKKNESNFICFCSNKKQTTKKKRKKKWLSIHFIHSHFKINFVRKNNFCAPFLRKKLLSFLHLQVIEPYPKAYGVYLLQSSCLINNQKFYAVIILQKFCKYNLQTCLILFSILLSSLLLMFCKSRFQKLILFGGGQNLSIFQVLNLSCFCFTRNCIIGFLKLYISKIATWSSDSIFSLCAFINIFS